MPSVSVTILSRPRLRRIFSLATCFAVAMKRPLINASELLGTNLVPDPPTRELSAVSLYRNARSQGCLCLKLNFTDVGGKPYPNPPSAAIRLVGGSHPTEGDVQIFHNNRWGSVCDDRWSAKNGLVVCRQLGYRDVLRVTKKNFFQGGKVLIWMDEVQCTGKENRLENCRFDGWERVSCAFLEAAGVVCVNETETEVSSGDLQVLLLSNETEGTVRLVGASVPGKGRLEVFLFGEWGTVCDDNWDSTNNGIVCRQLGYNEHFPISDYDKRKIGYGNGPILMTEVKCSGPEQNITSCKYKKLTESNSGCSHSEDVIIKCVEVDFDEEPWSLRLSGGDASMANGRVEVFLEGQWGTICNGEWDIADANVACHQLGFLDGAVSVDLNDHFGKAKLSSWMSKVRCLGNESRLADCYFEIPSIRRCGGASGLQNAGLTCKTTNVSRPTTISGERQKENVTLRLQGGKGPLEGRLEIFRNGKWGTVCRDSWDTKDAKVVCSQLGGYRPAPYQGSKSKLVGNGIIWMSYVFCSGNELRLDLCDFNGWGRHNCLHSKDVFVTCSKQIELKHPEWKLRASTFQLPFS
eukprot:m.75935 g.75935  ORF g.75935 m.75935 type:complete len:578 (+) comp35963_c0_seq11:708-2441(+)